MKLCQENSYSECKAVKRGTTTLDTSNDLLMPSTLRKCLLTHEIGRIRTVASISCVADYHRLKLEFMRVMNCLEALAYRSPRHTNFARAIILRTRDMLHREITASKNFDYH